MDSLSMMRCTHGCEKRAANPILGIRNAVWAFGITKSAECRRARNAEGRGTPKSAERRRARNAEGRGRRARNAEERNSESLLSSVSRRLIDPQHRMTIHIFERQI